MVDGQFLIEMGNRISSRRKEMKMTQEQVAEAMNISIQSLSCIELRKKAIRPENLYNLCNVLKVSSDYVLMGKKSINQMGTVFEGLSVMCEEDYKIIEGLVDRLNKK